MNEGKNDKEGGPKGQKREGKMEYHSPRQKPSRGRRGGGGGSQDDFPGVEISIAGGVGEMVPANNCDSFFFFSFFFFFF